MRPESAPLQPSAAADNAAPAVPLAAAAPAAVPEELATAWSSHEDLSPLAARFLRHALSSPDALRSVDYRQAESLPEWLRHYPYRLQPWPVFIDESKLRRVERATIGLTELVKSIPARLFGGDVRRISEFYGVADQGLMKLILAPPDGIATALARGDFVDDGADLRCLELNVGGTIGGWQDRFFHRVCLAQPWIAAFLSAGGVQARHRDPWRLALELIFDDGRRRGHDVAGQFNVAVALSPGSVEPEGAVEAMNDLFQEVLRDRGESCAGRVVRCTYPGDLAMRGGVLRFQELPISAVIETTEIQTPFDVFRCFKAQRLGLYNGPISGVLGSKRNLALLSQHEDSDLLSAEEREIVRRHVPWSRQVVDEHTSYRGERVRLLELAVARRESLVLKPVAGSQGAEVHLGRNTPAEEWRRRLDAAVGGPRMLLQEEVTSRPYLFQRGEDGWGTHQVIWGTFSIGGSYGGAFLRLLPFDRGPGVINSARGATEALVFEV
jgi:hypothetical protein